MDFARAEVSISGLTLTLKDIAIFSLGQPTRGLLRKVLRAIADLDEAARAAGFEKLVVEGARHPTASPSAHPVKIVEIVVDLAT